MKIEEFNEGSLDDPGLDSEEFETQTESVRHEAGLNMLRNSDPSIEAVLERATYVSVYALDAAHKWARAEIEGALFIVRRSKSPVFRLIVLNQQNPTNLVEDMSCLWEISSQKNFMFFRIPGSENEEDVRRVTAIWFCDDKERQAVEKVVELVISHLCRAEESSNESVSKKLVCLEAREIKGSEPVPKVTIIKRKVRDVNANQQDSVRSGTQQEGKKIKGACPSFKARSLTSSLLAREPGRELSLGSQQEYDQDFGVPASNKHAEIIYSVEDLRANRAEMSQKSKEASELGASQRFVKVEIRGVSRSKKPGLHSKQFPKKKSFPPFFKDRGPVESQTRVPNSSAAKCVVPNDSNSAANRNAAATIISLLNINRDQARERNAGTQAAPIAPSFKAKPAVASNLDESVKDLSGFKICSMRESVKTKVSWRDQSDFQRKPLNPSHLLTPEAPGPTHENEETLVAGQKEEHACSKVGQSSRDPTVLLARHRDRVQKKKGDTTGHFKKKKVSDLVDDDSLRRAILSTLQSMHFTDKLTDIIVSVIKSIKEESED